MCWGGGGGGGRGGRGGEVVFRDLALDIPILIVCLLNGCVIFKVDMRKRLIIFILIMLRGVYSHANFRFFGQPFRFLLYENKRQRTQEIPTITKLSLTEAPKEGEMREKTTKNNNNNKRHVRNTDA